MIIHEYNAKGTRNLYVISMMLHSFCRSFRCGVTGHLGQLSLPSSRVAKPNTSLSG